MSQHKSFHLGPIGPWVSIYHRVMGVLYILHTLDKAEALWVRGQITGMQCILASLSESGHEILVLCLCAFVLLSIIDPAGAAQSADTLRDHRRERRRARTGKEPRRDAPRPRGPSNVEHISIKGLAATPPKRHDPTGGGDRVYHRTPDRSEDGTRIVTRSSRLVKVAASHATVNSSGDCERPKAHRDGKGSRLAFSQTTSRVALTASVPMRISSSIRRKDAPRSNEVVVLGRREPNERWEQHAEEPPANLAKLAQLPFNRSAPTVMVAAERPAPRRTASFARMIDNTREAPKTPGTLPMPISLSLRPQARVSQRITLREYPAKL